MEAESWLTHVKCNLILVIRIKMSQDQTGAESEKILRTVRMKHESYLQTSDTLKIIVIRDPSQKIRFDCNCAGKCIIIIITISYMQVPAQWRQLPSNSFQVIY